MKINERYKNARCAIAAYAAYKGEPLKSDHILEESDVYDLMADLLHLARHYGMDVARVRHLAQAHYEAESEEDGWI